MGLKLYMYENNGFSFMKPKLETRTMYLEERGRGSYDYFKDVRDIFSGVH